ncbi:histone lysine methyltransferase Set9 [Cryptotrichosporon argae]
MALSRQGSHHGPARVRHSETRDPERERDTPSGSASSSARPDAVAVRNDAENLEEDDDACSWVLIDQLGALPDTKLGVHPQQVRFVPPPHKSDDVLAVIQKYIIQNRIPDIPAALEALLQLPPFKEHADGKATSDQVTRFKKHMRRYLLIFQPSSRVEIYTTNRYQHVTKHTELAVYATRTLQPGEEINELQGTMVDLPKEWEQDIDVADMFDAASENDNEGSDADGEDRAGSAASSRKGKEPAEARGARRSGRTRRRDFSIIYSDRKQRNQLFLGPARFLNHDCKPNVGLLRKGTYVTFRVLDQPIRIGEELTTMYAPNYFGEGNRECSLRQSNLPSQDDGDGNDAETVSASVADSAEQEDQEEPQRERYIRRARQKAKPLQWLSRKKRNTLVNEVPIEPEPDDEDEDSSDARCATCCKPFVPIWLQNRCFDHCARCVRHALIFLLPWPSHRPQDIATYPPTHLLPRNFKPRKVLDVPLPSLTKAPKPPRQLVASARATPDPNDERLPSATRETRALDRQRDEEELQLMMDDRMAEIIWQEIEEAARRDAIKLAKEAKRRAEREAQLAAKMKRDATKIKGSGVWQKYEILTEEEFARREAAKHVMTTGTRRGGRFRASEEEQEMRQQAEEARRLQVEREAARERVAKLEEKESEDGDDEAAEDSEAEADEAASEVGVEVGSEGNSAVGRPSSDMADNVVASAEASKTASASRNAPDTAPHQSTVAKQVETAPASNKRTPSASLPVGTPVIDLVDHSDDTDGLALPKARAHGRRTGGTQNDAIAIESSDAASTSSVSTENPQRRRGRPPGTGKHQLAAKRNEARRGGEMQTSIASPRTPAQGKAATGASPKSSGMRANMVVIDSSDGEDSDDEIECLNASKWDHKGFDRHGFAITGVSPKKPDVASTPTQASVPPPRRDLGRSLSKPSIAQDAGMQTHSPLRFKVGNASPAPDMTSLDDASPPSMSTGTSGSADRDSVEDVEALPAAGPGPAASKRPRPSPSPEKSPSHTAKRALFATAIPFAPDLWRKEQARS